ncbi:glucose-1-phosphate adenylyltransferase family protein [Modestobacter versicolor]|uniref:Glucose-1-phosphate adenylyltransferase n=1 Tax=Modestobacter versicolor TaxID=429133 RepID=A0A323VFE9_9ACTN|nr:glucose-1-phosphate adenylyltransferase family protein [Modestobacter versicolor]MBB3676655.1 glucose-1-phosphate adenylyltransferase [Modestobacter versicolor]PZA23375.1 glucose-1-phosphate adenylyltransferase [Modestobacter versicolor]
MALPKVLVLVLAGGKGSRLELLTETRAKPAVPFAGVYRLVDFPLSNCEHSGIADVWVSVQYQPQSLSEHLANGRPWDLDRTTGGLMMLPPFQGSERGGFTEGTADGLWRQAELIRQFAPDALVVVSSDAVYKLDYREVVDAHLASGAEVTMVTTEVEPDDAARYGIVQVDDDGRVTDYAYKPDEPATTTATNEVFVFSPAETLDRLEALNDTVGEDGLEDLGNHLLPAQTKDGLARAYPLQGYWRDVGTVESYWQAHQDFLSAEPPIDLDERSWPVHTRGGRHSAARVLAGGNVDGSLVSGGTRVAGTVRGSVLSPGVIVEEGATVVDSVLLPGVHVRAGATVTRAVLDDNVVVGERATVGGDGDITLVGRESTVPDGGEVPAGGRLPEPERS